MLLRRFRDLNPEDVDADPLVVLRCGHAYLASTMDGHTKLEERFYVRGGAGRVWGTPSCWVPERFTPVLGSVGCCSLVSGRLSNIVFRQSQ